jgi:hypothetical protein
MDQSMNQMGYGITATVPFSIGPADQTINKWPGCYFLTSNALYRNSFSESKGTHNACLFPVSVSVILHKTPLFRQETGSPSSREATRKARAPRSNRRRELRCMAASSQVDATLGSRVGRSRTVVWSWDGTLLLDMPAALLLSC